ncbi:phosphatase PAP2 family protein [Prescottella equi]|uniref:phosphatase PAP2 family protein n=1 Tax=Rhodococcus hoagii TaxID=43767 RepID=UPI0025763269|nr:phosphatase PAP2 family protein [Prescottella equi]WJJ12759.1 phosphatase PAP2 family protein [Prescottella equi]
MRRTSERAGMMLVAAAVVVVALYLLRGVGAAIYRAIVPHTSDLPGVGMIAEIGLLALVALFAVLAVQMWRTRSPHLGELLMGGFGVVVAYVLSEVIKTFVSEDRPCRVELTLADCPAPGDWSFPSNHTVIAFGLATAIVLATERILSSLQRGLVIALAALIGLARVLQGVHYPHDVLAGAVVGSAVTIAVVAMLLPWAQTKARSLGRRPARTSEDNPAADVDA